MAKYFKTLSGATFEQHGDRHYVDGTSVDFLIRRPNRALWFSIGACAGALIAKLFA